MRLVNDIQGGGWGTSRISARPLATSVVSQQAGILISYDFGIGPKGKPVHWMKTVFDHAILKTSPEIAVNIQ